MAHYQFVGVVRTPAGELAVRYASDARTRTRVLRKHGYDVLFFLDAGQPEHTEELMHQLLDHVEANELIDLVDTVRTEAEAVGFVF
jgi:hypothetical protein